MNDEAKKIREAIIRIVIPEGVPGVAAGTYLVTDASELGVIRTTERIKGVLCRDDKEFTVRGKLSGFWPL